MTRTATTGSQVQWPAACLLTGSCGTHLHVLPASMQCAPADDWWPLPHGAGRVDDVINVSGHRMGSAEVTLPAHTLGFGFSQCQLCAPCGSSMVVCFTRSWAGSIARLRHPSALHTKHTQRCRALLPSPTIIVARGAFQPGMPTPHCFGLSPGRRYVAGHARQAGYRLVVSLEVVKPHHDAHIL